VVTRQPENTPASSTGTTRMTSQIAGSRHSGLALCTYRDRVRIQRVAATASENFSDGVMNSRVLRGRPFSSAATVSRSLKEN